MRQRNFQCRTRTGINFPNISAPEAVVEAQSNMLRPLKQLRRLVWLEYHKPRSNYLPWPEMPPSLEELVFMPRGEFFFPGR